MSSSVTLAQALAVVGAVAAAVEIYRKSHKTIADDVTLAEAIIQALVDNNIGVADVTAVLNAIKPYLGLIAAATSKAS